MATMTVERRRQTNLRGESADYVAKRDELRLAEIELMRHSEVSGLPSFAGAFPKAL